MGDAKKLKSPPEKVEDKLKKHTKEDLIDIVHKAKCKKLRGMKVEGMSKQDLVDHIIKVKCPEIIKIIGEKSAK